MSRRWCLWLCVLAVFAASCTGGSSVSSPEAGSETEDATTSTTPDSSEDSPDQTVPDQTVPDETVPDDQAPDPDDPSSGPDPTLPGGPAGIEALDELEGRLAITDRTSLLIIDPTGANGEIVDEAPNGLIAQPTWSPDGGQIAWSRLESSGGDQPGSLERMTLPDLEAGSEGGERISTSTGSAAPIYLQWTEDGSRIAMLQNGEGGIELSTIEGQDGPQLLGTGTPFYFAWGPDNQAMAWHRNNAVEVRRGLLPDDLGINGGAFSAPDWFTDDEIMAVKDSKLVLVDPDNGLVNEVAVAQTPTQFVLHAETGRVAYLGPGSDLLTIGLAQTPEPDPGESEPDEDDPETGSEPDEDDPETGSESDPGDDDAPLVLRVLDLRTETEVLVTDEPVLAWEWSPDGQRLAYLARSEFDENKLRWFFWQDGRVVGATSQFLTAATERQVYLPFFAQYAQSHTRWSPTGQGFAFAGTVDEVSGVFVHVLGETPQSILIADGDFVTWSPETVANGSGISPL